MLLTLVAVCAVNVWTGGPLLALWVGSRLEASAGHLTVPGLGAIAATLGAVEYGLLRLLQWLSAAYDRLTGRKRSRPQATWLRSLRDSGRLSDEQDRKVNAVDAIVILSVVIVMIAFEV